MRRGVRLEMIPCQNTQIASSRETGKTKYGGSVHLLPPSPDEILPATTTPTPTNISHSSLAPCHYEGKYFTLGESWLRKDCFHCTCLHPVGVGCCDT